MILPNFIICGAQRSGTTSLYHYLAQHPDVFMSPQKEIHYFSHHHFHQVEWYAHHFVGATGYSVIGEASPTYMDTPGVPNRISSLLPEAKLCFILRNPVDRAYSSYLHSLKFSKGPASSFSEAIRQKEGYMAYVQRGFYYQFLQNFMEHFRRDQIHLLITEELKQNPLSIISDCFDFLGIDNTYRPNVSVQFNASLSVQPGNAMIIQKRWQKFKGTLLRTQRFSPAFRRNTSSIRQKASRLFFRPMDKEKRPISSEDNAYLSEIYSRQVELLESLMGRTLPWFRS